VTSLPLSAKTVASGLCSKGFSGLRLESAIPMPGIDVEERVTRMDEGEPDAFGSTAK